MTIYEKENDHGLAGTWNSLVWGSAGRPIACCNIHGYSIIKPHYEVMKKEEKAGRGLDEEHEENQIDDEEYHDDEEEYE